MSKKYIIGREPEIAELQKVFDSKQSEFVAIYGRRRIGKTFLVREFFEDRFLFAIAGLSHESTEKQLQNFHNEMCRWFPEYSFNIPQNWLQAFNDLSRCLALSRKKRKVIFFDELPWMDVPKSGFISALENFWNGWVSGRHDVVLIVCGSATSWMIDKLINNHGGLHGRLTKKIFLRPFNLLECEKMLSSIGLRLSRYEIAECYMIFGGVPYYLNKLDASKSLAQNVDNLLLDEEGELHYEFDNLYSSLFKNSADYVEIVRLLSQRRGGFSREEISIGTKISSGGRLSTILKNLVSCGFIRKYENIGDGGRTLYQLIDFFTLFHYRFMARDGGRMDSWWSGIQGTSIFLSWVGLTFELLALHHVPQIKHKLGISGVMTEEYAWRKMGNEREGGSQIDLIIERRDRTVNLCELKFYTDDYRIDKEENMRLQKRINAFREDLGSKTKSIRLTIVTTFGLSKSGYNSIVNDVVLLDDLFC